MQNGVKKERNELPEGNMEDNWEYEGRTFQHLS